MSIHSDSGETKYSLLRPSSNEEVESSFTTGRGSARSADVKGSLQVVDECELPGCWDRRVADASARPPEVQAHAACQAVLELVVVQSDGCLDAGVPLQVHSVGHGAAVAARAPVILVALLACSKICKSNIGMRVQPVKHWNECSASQSLESVFSKSIIGISVQPQESLGTFSLGGAMFCATSHKAPCHAMAVLSLLAAF